jgi:filamentous hemagglutinin
LSLNPAAFQKRLGDGYYEQQKINEQILQKTGKTTLGNYASNEAQFQALMDAGITYARQFNIVPGIALSAAQMAALTSDIVWLVAQDVTLPDGSTQPVSTASLRRKALARGLAQTAAMQAAPRRQLSAVSPATRVPELAMRKPASPKSSTPTRCRKTSMRRC